MENQTLGQKHKNLNKRVQDAIERNSSLELGDIDYNQPDIENLFKIDYACRTKNVDYLLKVFKCEDMLFVSRALKHSVWLIKDPQYAYIINPNYLHKQLFPYMLAPAKNKFLLSIRSNLKDPIRNGEFFNYLKDIDLNMAMKWFSNCSPEFIASKLEEDIYRIPDDVFLRLFYINIDTLQSYVKNHYWHKPMLEKTMFLISKHGEKYFDVLDTVDKGQIPTFNAKYTKMAMKLCPHRLMFKFNRYIYHIDQATFVKYIKVDDFQEFQNKNFSHSQFKILFPKEKCENIMKKNNHNILLKRLMKCNQENFNEVKVILYILQNKHLDDLKYRLKIINIVIKRFKTHRFDTKTWRVFNNILIKIGAYAEYKKHFRPCIKSAISYHIIHNNAVPEEILTKFKDFDTYKKEINKFNEDEKDRIFKYLYQFVLSKLESDDSEQVLTWLDNALLLFRDWKKDWMEYTEIVHKIYNLIRTLKDATDNESIKKLYFRKRPWRRILFNESFTINSNEDVCISFLKYNPDLLKLNSREIQDLCLNERKSMNKFLQKVRIYWSSTFANDLKIIYKNQLRTSPNSRFYKLLSRPESVDIFEKNIPDIVEIDWNDLNEIHFRKHIAKNMHNARPKPPLDLVLQYAKGIYLQDSYSSIKSVLNCMSSNQTREYIDKLQKWPEFVQKLFVLQTFKKLNKSEYLEFIFSIWNTTQYCSVRADIFKHYFKSLKKYTHNDINKNDAYHGTVEEIWSTFKILIASLTENECVTVYNLLSKFEKLPHIIRTEYCVMSYKFLKSLPPGRNCQKFMNSIVSKIEYNKVLLNLDLDVLSEMVNDTITKRIWMEKLDWSFIYVLVKCLICQKDDEQTNLVFEKVLNPVLEKAYAMWNVKILDLYMVRFNIYNFISWLYSSYKDILVHSRSPTPLVLLHDSFKKNLSLRDNYVLITNVKLAAEFLKILSKREKESQILFEEIAPVLSKLCVEMFCEDVQSVGENVLIFYHHALQMALNGFGMQRKTQHNIYNCMLDISKYMSSEMDVLVNILALQHCFYESYDKEDKKGRRAVLDRINAHSSPVVKAHYSKLIMTNTCMYAYDSLLYHIMSVKT